MTFTPTGVPSPPALVAASPADAQATVTWQPPAAQASGVPGDNGSAITGYTVTTYLAADGSVVGEPVPTDKLRAEMHRRMLGNGYCARAVEMDCHFESICESCSFFVTTIEFKPTLQRQRVDAATKGQVGRQRIFDNLLNRLDGEAS